MSYYSSQKSNSNSCLLETGLLKSLCPMAQQTVCSYRISGLRLCWQLQVLEKVLELAERGARNLEVFELKSISFVL